MTVRDANFADIPQIADLLVEAHGRSRYAGTDVQVDVRETKALLSRSIQRHGGEHIGSTLVLVAQRDSFVTGVLMFFHLDSGLNKLAHEWLSWAMVVGVALHVLLNLPAFKRYLGQKLALGVMGVFALVLALSFFSPAGAKKEPPFGAPIHALAKALTRPAHAWHRTPVARWACAGVWAARRAMSAARSVLGAGPGPGMACARSCFVFSRCVNRGRSVVMV